MVLRPPRSTLSSSSAASDVYKRQKYYQAPLQTIMDVTQPVLQKFVFLQNFLQQCSEFMQKHCEETKKFLTKKEYKEYYKNARIMTGIMYEYFEQLFWQSCNFIKFVSLNPYYLIQYDYLGVAQSKFDNTVQTAEQTLVETWKDWTENNLGDFAIVVAKKQRVKLMEQWQWAKNNFEKLQQQVEFRKKIMENQDLDGGFNQNQDPAQLKPQYA
eukprot:TRINITY_DN11430_c0_g1_i1.p1 TRINITY_DN11430_c0_g1~~TRINITY_DN11430_c0_g1_i1.p1  ORF type:complete len:213 (+),score=26.75 TRINITY_DN11430_c0_g1_i1:59-697(+)